VHEYSIAASLFRLVDGHARRENAARVIAVHVRVGAQAGVELDLLETAWEAVRAGTVCASAALHVESPPTRWICGLCAAPVPEDGPRRCPRCDVPARLATGAELTLERIELERDDAND